MGKCFCCPQKQSDHLGPHEAVCCPKLEAFETCCFLEPDPFPGLREPGSQYPRPRYPSLLMFLCCWCPIPQGTQGQALQSSQFTCKGAEPKSKEGTHTRHQQPRRGTAASLSPGESRGEPGVGDGGQRGQGAGRAGALLPHAQKEKLAYGSASVREAAWREHSSRVRETQVQIPTDPRPAHVTLGTGLTSREAHVPHR